MSRTLVEASRGALSAAIAERQDVLVLGEDVAAGGPFGLTKGLVDRFGPHVVRNTPISESAVMGVAVGMALGGRRPFVDLMFNDFVTLAADQLLNHAAKIHFMSGGRRSVPLAVWTIGGAGTRWGAQHSQRLDGLLALVPGLVVLAPSTPLAAAAAVRAAIDHDDPVVVLVDRSLLYTRDALDGDGGDPFRCRRARAGQQVTVVSTGRLVHLAVRASSGAFDADVFDLQCLAPLDLDPLVASAERTGRVLVVHDESPATGGIAAGVAAEIGRRAFWHLDAPVAVVTSPPTPVPAGPELEDEFVIAADDLRRALGDLCGA